MPGKKKLAIRFEEDLKDFLIKLDFKDVEGAKDTFKIGGVQVDVCGGHENILFIIECCMAVKLKKKSLRKKIKELRGISHTIKKSIKSHPLYKKYENIRYVLATKNIDVKRGDIVFANKDDPRVYMWDENFRKYYSTLFEKIGHFAKFNLLGEMGIKPSQINPIIVPAFMTTIMNTRMFTFVMNPKDLLEISYVARRETRNERYYQRILRKKRIEDIAKYVDKKNFLPNNIIIAFNEELRKSVKFHTVKSGDKFSITDWPFKDISYGILEFPKGYRSCWIIDGQHRLYSFVNSKKTFHMPIVVFDNLALEDQCKIFLDINKYQKPVPPDLVWDLNGDMLPSQEEGIISKAVKSLNLAGHLRHRIYIPSTGIRSKRNLLRMSGICNNIKNNGLAKRNTRSKVVNPFYYDKPENVVKNLSKALDEYFGCIHNKFKDDWNKGNKGFTLSNSGNAILIGLFERIVRKTIISKSTAPNILDYTKYLEPMKKLFAERFNNDTALKQLKLRITSEGGRRLFLNELIRYIAQMTGDSEFASGVEFRFSEVIRELEKDLKELIRKILSEGEIGDWFREKMDKINPAIYKRAIKNLKKHHITDPDKAYMQLIFGDCIAVVTSKQFGYKFVKVFCGTEEGFNDKNQFVGALNHINRIRQTQFAHNIGVSLKSTDWELFHIYMRIMKNCVSSALQK